MEDKAGDLRRYAANCRFMARSALSMRARAALFAMAIELEGQAEAIGPADPIASAL